ncbi:aminotransferase DegT [Drancourtella sp. An12]|uniref:DegT/DnrJ/EryC1/StrS family aminotransferase n=1 Tax=Drancourtella sp. An12 TaxID=1965548 RepID=UPI000B3A1FCD|nr:DegT/DnrJ/EryC1/StrS family aminotransferase [Drancourtella sp. An12]OUQ45165.1 aminotransferase DegT [Drancourtella sp. An12]
MQFRDLKTQYQQLKPEIDAAIAEVLENANFISGRQVGELEEELAQYVGVKHCITCGNGTDALSMMMMAWNIGKGDAVFVPDFTFFASGEIVSFEGATPVFYDVCMDTFNADVTSLENSIINVLNEGKLTPRAIIAVDLFGLPANYIKLEEIAKKYKLLLLEDGAQGFGGKIGERRVGSFGDAATTSFFPAKPLGCYGDGGAIFTNDDNIAELLKSIRVHGKGSFKYDNVRIGWNSRLDTLQAAILKVKFKAFREYELEEVNRVADTYRKELMGVVKIPVVREGFYSSWAQYTLQLSSKDERDQVQEALKEKGIPTIVYYPKPMHQQVAFSGNKMYVECPNTEKLCDTVLSLPMHPYLSNSDIQEIAMAVKLAINKKS